MPGHAVGVGIAGIGEQALLREIGEAVAVGVALELAERELEIKALLSRPPRQLGGD